MTFNPVPKPSELGRNKTIKKCVFCKKSEVVYVRTKNCPKCKRKGTLVVDEKKKKEVRKRKCACGCGEIVYYPKKYVSGHNLKRRPKNAIVINGRSHLEINCSMCDSKITRRMDGIKDKNYCEKCLSIVRSNNSKGRILHKARHGEYKNCLHCKEEFYVNPYRAKHKNPKYCSKKCQMQRQVELGIMPKGFISSVDNRGNKNGMYKHGKRIGSHINKKKLRGQVIKRDGGNWCLLCGKPGPGLHLHRIIYGSQGGKYELDNCVQLCAVCHDKVHSSKKNWMPKLLEHIEKKKVEQHE